MEKMNMEKKSIAILIPCYNESKTVAKVVKDYKKVLPEADIYVYDNNSTDGTDELAKKAGAIVRYEYRQGKGNVIRSMFKDIDADCYLMIDGDDTYPAEDARKMCDLVLSGKADMVVGDRLSSTYFTENKRPLHNFGNRLVRWLINHLFDNKIKDIMTGYRAFSYDFVKGFPVLSKGFEIETEMTIHAVDKNFKVVEIPVQYRDRPSGSVSKLNTYKDGFKVLKTIATLFKEYKPSAFFNILALIFFIIGVIIVIPAYKIDLQLQNATIVNQPTIISPTDGAVDFIGSITSTYSTSDYYEGLQTKVIWECALDDTFNDIIDSYEGSDNLTSWTPTIGLALTQVFIRTKQISYVHRSKYSEVISFTTPNIFVQTPTLTIEGEITDVIETPTITLGAFSVYNGTDTHKSSSYRIK